jgi:hypothetical protein
MSNKLTIKPPIEVVIARLGVLFEAINDRFQSGDMILESELIDLYHNAIRTFYESMDRSSLKLLPDFQPGTPADPREVNDFTKLIQQDLRSIYLEISALDKLITASFNSIIAERDQILQISKRISNKLGDYLLYADPSLGAGYFFGDSFNTKDKIDGSSILLEGDECYQSTEEGAIFLPLDGNPDKPVIKSIIINKQSNGFTGSNYQLDVFGHDSIEAIGDGEPNTWFEYERVVANESILPLILDITIALEEISVINHIHINPINFGTPTPVKVLSIQTSKDGIEYVTIKEDIPIKDFVSEVEDNVFELSSATSNFSGQGFFSFQARKAQYIHIILQQSTPYSIETINGPRLRYAIGIRDINVLGRKFKSSGSIISLPFDIGGDARKVSLWSAENPKDRSILADVLHAISHDDGATWFPIQPQEREGNTIPEIVDFNTISPSSIETSDSVVSLRHKISMTRDSEAFNGDTIIKEEELSQLDIVDVPTGGEFDVTVTQTPIKNTVRILFPFSGSWSCPRARSGSEILDESFPMDLDFVEFSVDVPGETLASDGAGGTKPSGTLRYKLPFKNIPNLSSHIRVFVNGAQIEYAVKQDDLLTSIDEYSKVYYLNKGGSELQFGYIDASGDRKGYIPSSGSKISVCLDGDNPFLRLTDRGYVLNLTNSSDGDKETVSLVALKTLEEESSEQYEVEIPPGIQAFRLPIVDKAIGEYVSPTSSYDNSGSINTYNTSSTPIVESNIQESQDMLSGEGVSFGEGSYTSGVPVFLSGTNNFYIKEYDLSGVLLTGTPSSSFSIRTEYIDGSSELTASNYYSFDYNTGTVYLGRTTREGVKTVFICKKLKAERIPDYMWKFDTDLITGRMNPQKIVLDPRAVHTIKQQTSYTLGDTQKSIALIQDNIQQHSFYNKRLVRGTIKPSLSLFPSGAKPTEILFIDGLKEFSNIVMVQEEMIFSSYGTNLWSYTLSGIDSLSKEIVGSPGFAPIRSTESTTIPTNQFSIDGQKASVSDLSSGSDGDWAIITSGSTTTIVLRLSSTPSAHTVTYRFQNNDPGIDASGQYSIDYINGVIHFAQNINNSGIVEYEVSLYSAFYNMGETVNNTDIKKIDENNKKIYFSPAFGIRFLKLDTVSKNRPQILKVYYNYHNVSTESLADIEPYFSPACKDIAFRVVTSSILEDL